jgi:hypothetical protein
MSCTRSLGLPLLALAALPLAVACGIAPRAVAISPAPCPARYPGQPPAHSHPGRAAHLVPGSPAVVTVCGYTATGGPAGSRVLRGVTGGAPALAAQLNRLRHVPKPINFMCVHRLGGAFLLRFRYAAGPGADVLIQGSDCRFASNGDLLAFTTDGLQARLAALAG